MEYTHIHTHTHVRVRIAYEHFKFGKMCRVNANYLKKGRPIIVCEDTDNLKRDFLSGLNVRCMA